MSTLIDNDEIKVPDFCETISIMQKERSEQGRILGNWRRFQYGEYQHGRSEAK